MTPEQLDVLWSRAMAESIAAGEPFTRYRFAALVAAHEREACARVCDAHAAESWGLTEEESAAQELAKKIRARSPLEQPAAQQAA